MMLRLLIAIVFALVLLGGATVQTIYLPALSNGQEQPGSAQSLDARPIPTATPSGLVTAAPTVPTTPQYRETIDLVPNLPKEEKALLIFRNNKGAYINYLVDPAEVREQIIRISQELGPESFQNVAYPHELYPWLVENEPASPLLVATPDPSFVHPEVPVPPTPRSR